jgi:hypothetical protein
VAALVDPVLEIQNIEDQSADRHQVVIAGRDFFKALFGFSPEAADHGFVRFNVERAYGGESGAK